MRTNARRGHLAKYYNLCSNAIFAPRAHENMTNIEPILPITTDRDTAPIFAAAAERRLVYRTCHDCDAGLHPPTEHCPRCGGWNTGWREDDGAATLYSWSTVAHSVHPAYPSPYTVAVVTLDSSPDVRFVTQLAGAPDLRAGQPMKLWFEDTGKGVMLPQWAPV